MNDKDQNEIADRVIALVSDEMNVPREQISAHSSLEELGVDSLNGLNIITQVENAFRIHVGEEDLLNLRTIGDIASSVEKSLGAKASGS